MTWLAEFKPSGAEVTAVTRQLAQALPNVENPQMYAVGILHHRFVKAKLGGKTHARNTQGLQVGTPAGKFFRGRKLS
jgi:hypothetical protein